MLSFHAEEKEYYVAIAEDKQMFHCGIAESQEVQTGFKHLIHSKDIAEVIQLCKNLGIQITEEMFDQETE